MNGMIYGVIRAILKNFRGVIMNNINNLQEQFENLIKQGQELLEKMKEERFADVSKKVKRWKPKDGDVYYGVMSDGNIRTNIWESDVFDCGYYSIGNCFKTEEEAQKELNRRRAEQELLDMCDWKDGECAEIVYDFEDKEFSVEYAFTTSCYSPYRFATKESCQKAIDTLGTEKLKLIFRID